MGGGGGVSANKIEISAFFKFRLSLGFEKHFWAEDACLSLVKTFATVMEI